jgi:hypothetical protein
VRTRATFGIVALAALWALVASGGCGGQEMSPATGDAGRRGVGASSDGGETLEAGESSGGGESSSDGAAKPDGTVAVTGFGQPPLTSVDKVDLLFDIDNSSSMGDKQEYLAQAIPDLVARLVTPNCVDGTGAPTGVVADLNGHCATGTVEFPPVRDMHIGIVTSSLGPRLGNACNASETQAWTGGTVSRHNDDQAHLINRGSDPSNLSNYTESPLVDMGTGNFLDWFPQVGADGGSSSTVAVPIGDVTQLKSDFQSLVAGVHQFGCGIESQLESWYRFLIQPDPYASLGFDSSGKFAQWVGVDTVLLAQRADFLRPDSLVAIIVLSDENDSEVDVRSFGATGWNFMSTEFNPPRGTSACGTTPGATACTSCAFGKNPTDSECMREGGFYTAQQDENNWGYDLNLRHVHEKQKYGASVQFPIQRYVLGLTSAAVPNRDSEYPAGATEYQGLSNRTCENPLFAGKLPAPPAGVDPSQWQPTASELCSLPIGHRNPSLVYYAHIGGVPRQLLQQDPSNPDSPQKAALTAADWTLILGNDPLNYDYSGIDPHMVESYQPRTNVAVPTGGFPVADPSAAEGTDPISGREWVTDSTAATHQSLLVDREYACTFKLAAPRACDATATAADPTLSDSCDCEPPLPGTGSFTHEQVPAACNDATPTQQDYAKAYPTVRELLLAKLLGQVQAANVGIISSICPIHTTEATPGDPLYGYRPAVSAIVNGLKQSL